MRVRRDRRSTFELLGHDWTVRVQALVQWTEVRQLPDGFLRLPELHL